jgi:putative ABC transport system permease protein
MMQNLDFPWLEELFVDVRYGIRAMRNKPGFAMVAVLTLALGIGANTAAYSIIHGTLQLPYANAKRIVVVRDVYPRLPYFALSWPDFLDLRSRSRSFVEMAGLFTTRMTWKGRSDTEDLNIGLITQGYFRVYGTSPILGRTLVASDHQQGSETVCALGENFWRNELKGDPYVVGKPLNLDGKNCNIIGVMPRVIPDSNHPAQVWLPMELNLPMRERGSGFMQVVGLLKPGVSQPEAQTELRGIQSQINRQFPEDAHTVALKPLSQFVFGDLRAVMYILLAAVGFILLIACVNLANMLLARAVDRTQEFAVRYALGASPGRLLRQTLTESLLLSVSGALLGLMFAAGLTHIPLAAWPKGFLQPASVHLDGRILAFTTLLALATGIFFGAIPALHLLWKNDASALPQGRATTKSREQMRSGSILVIVEIALCMLLVAGSLNMAFYFGRLIHNDPGMNPQNVLSMAVSLSQDQYSDPKSKLRFYHDLLDRLSALPGVKDVAATLVPPFWGVAPSGKFSYDDQASGTSDSEPIANFLYVTPGYFATMQTPILQGRNFGSQDRLDSPKVAIINRGMANRLWPGQSALGKTIHRGKDRDFVVIGIAPDVPFLGLAQAVGNQIYISIEQDPPSGLSVLLRTQGEPLAYVESFRRTVISIDPGRAVSNITSVQALADQTIAGQRTSTIVTAILGALALLLAAVGIYGVMAYSVSRREREFGIRIALGSSRSNILTLLFSKVLRLVFAGMVLGACLTFAMRAWVASLLGASHENILALGVSGLLLCFVAALATLIPARRASCIDPIQSLRSE